MSHASSPRSVQAKESLTSDRSSQLQQQFPHQTDKEFVVERTRKDTGQFVLPPSPADSMLDTNQHSPRAFGVEGNRLMRDIDRGAPGDQAIFSDLKTPEQKQLAKRKSQHYSDAFANRESNSSARERVLRESTVMADVRTNVIIDDEYTFITDLSYSLSGRYQRPESSILVTVSHSACLLFGGSFDPAYTMTITALPSQVQAVTNKRNAVLLQKSMEEALGVPADRGLIKFIAISEENLATNGKTAAGEIEDLERLAATESGISTTRRKSSASAAKSNKRKSTRSLKNLKTSANHLQTHNEMSTPPLSERDTETPPLPPLPAIPLQPNPMDKMAEKVQKISKRKSFMAAMFGK